ncbi:aspartyl-phosphate phosphatase Spo0E family protein [Bacillus sp. T33-2]|uniref:aspartyl-phosphate phosphatase Spo0E family protein n=1 Tax=Bacillus sp. T33-2 TaxID=2054168 RepID=UPI000C776B5E|nr:aspartyl-phosphate phosphatase Spo0E family protein [Bacillus sp. T33-2]PLR97543.1 hypothetical protein CVD19_08660 [Bacillus sp. T33-2]
MEGLLYHSHKDLQYQIESLKIHMMDIALKYGLNHEITIQISQELDYLNICIPVLTKKSLITWLVPNKLFIT